jgi:hypothetical protein
MKKYLFGLGAMLVGAGLMFVLMHGEVSAEGEKVHCELIDLGNEAEAHVVVPKPDWNTHNKYKLRYSYCKIKDVTCVSTFDGISCVKN